MVHMRLEAWGKWAHENTGAWPPQTLLGRMIEQGPMGAAQAGKPPISMPAEIAATDAAVARLGMIDRRALTDYYTRWEPLEVLARRASMRTRQLQRVLQRARWRVAVILGEV